MKEYIKGENPYMPLWEHVPDGEPRRENYDGLEKVRLLDRARNEVGAEIDCGDFSGSAKEPHAVERNLDLTITPEFTDNWCHEEGGGDKPFAMDICCRELLIVYMDSGLPEVGKAEVFVDGVRAPAGRYRIRSKGKGVCLR